VSDLLPDFIALGPPKTATTSLYYYLRQHPQLYLPAQKELGFFAFEGMGDVRFPQDNLATDLDAYSAFFKGASSDQLRGEVSSLYAISKRAPHRMAEVVPHAKLIITLRNPADRAYSEFLMNVGSDLEARSLATAIDDEPLTDLFYSSNHYLESRVVRNGFYYAYLSRFYDRFPRANLHVVLFEELTQDPQGVLRGVFEFLGVDPGATIDTNTAHNRAQVPRSRALHHLLVRPNLPRELVKAIVPKPIRQSVRDVILRVNLHRPASAITPAIRRRLIELYRDDILKLEQLIQRDLSHWLTLLGG
jgi:hypothetical protein